MITLVHTGLQMPHDHLKVTSLKQLTLDCGVAFRAVLRHNGRRVGEIVNEGRGGATMYRPDSTEFTRHDLETFVEACQRNGTPLESIARTEGVLNDLIEEYDMNRTIRRATRNGGTYVRLLDEEYGHHSHGWSVRQAPTTEEERTSLAASIEREARRDGLQGTLQVWAGDAWAPLRPATADQSPSVTVGGKRRL